MNNSKEKIRKTLKEEAKQAKKEILEDIRKAVKSINSVPSNKKIKQQAV